MAKTSEGARPVRIGELRRCLAVALERLHLAPEDAFPPRQDFLARMNARGV
jgi:hypothetical protein